MFETKGENLNAVLALATDRVDGKWCRLTQSLRGGKEQTKITESKLFESYEIQT